MTIIRKKRAFGEANYFQAHPHMWAHHQDNNTLNTPWTRSTGTISTCFGSAPSLQILITNKTVQECRVGRNKSFTSSDSHHLTYILTVLFDICVCISIYIYIYLSLYIIYQYIKGTYSPKDRIKRCDLDAVNTSSDVEAQVVSA